MNTLILTAGEYEARRTGDMPALVPHCDPWNTAVVVLEDGDKIAACVSVLRVTHFEGLWIDPAHRGNAGVWRALIRQAYAIPRARGEQWAFGGAEDGDESMERVLGFLGGATMNLKFSVLRVGEEPCLQQ